MEAPGVPELALEGRGGGEIEEEVPPDSEGNVGVDTAAKAPRMERRGGLASHCITGITDYQAAIGLETRNPVFGHLMGEIGKIVPEKKMMV